MPTAKLPEMTSAEKVTMIQERMRNIQKKWAELKVEMSKIDRKRRKARKREREGKDEDIKIAKILFCYIVWVKTVVSKKLKHFTFIDRHKSRELINLQYIPPL